MRKLSLVLIVSCLSIPVQAETVVPQTMTVRNPLPDTPKTVPLPPPRPPLAGEQISKEKKEKPSETILNH